MVNVSVHEKTFLVKEKSSLITFTESLENIELEDMAKNVLKELYYNSRENIASIADKYHTTVDIVRNRMRKLEEQKIIVRYTIQINYQKIGYELYKAFIYLRSFSKENVKAILKYAEQSDKIINIVKQIAPWDIEFIIFANNFQDYNQVVGEFTKQFSNSIKKVESATMSEDIIFPCKKLVFE